MEAVSLYKYGLEYEISIYNIEGTKWISIEIRVINSNVFLVISN